MQEKHAHNHDLNVKKIDKLSSTRVRLTIEYSGDPITDHEQAVANRYSRNAKIPGFRPGKAPLSIIKSKFKDEILKDVVSHLLEAGLHEALEKTKLNPVSRPQIKIGEVAVGKPFGFDAEFDVQPDVELKNYKKIPVKKVDTTVTEDELTKTLDGLRDRMANLEPVEATKAEKGFFAVVEVAVELTEPPHKKEENKTYTVELGANRLLANIEAALLEMKVGESRKVEDKFPEDYPEKDFAGKTGSFDIKLVELKKKALPELNDAFASQLKEGATLDVIKTELKENLSKGKEVDGTKAQREALVEYLVKNNKFDVAESMVDSQAGELIQWMQEDWKKRGLTPPVMKKEDLQQVRTRAENMVRSSLLLREVAMKENISLDTSRFQAKVEALAGQLGRPVDETEKLLAGRGMLDRMKDEVLTDQVFEFLLSQAKME